jgi:hypothetical protein
MVLQKVQFKFFWLCLLLFAVQPTMAQKPLSFVANGGARGNYIIVGVAKVSKAQPFNGVVGYRVERKKRGESGWTSIADVEAPASLAEFQARLKRIEQTMPDVYDAAALPIERYWAQAEKSRGRIDTLFYSNFLAVRLAIGMVYLDSTAQKNTAYQYRVLQLDAAGEVKDTWLSEVVSYPKPLTAKPKFISKFETFRQLTLRFGAVSKVKFGVQAFRREGVDGAFQRITPEQLLARGTKNPDSLYITIVDTLIGLSKYYQYVVVPQDYYGNLGTPSDTVLATTFDFRQVSIPDYLQAQSMKDTAGLKLTWRLRDTANVVSVEILRSLDADTGFVRLAAVPPTQTSYLDETTEPMQRYFYRLVATGPFGERSVPSARAFGIYESPLPPLPPRLIQVDGVKNGVQLTIENSDPTVIGYRIYRNARYGDTLTLISGLVLRASAPTTSFLDSSLGLSGRLSYGYAVRSESKSHVLSGFSDTLYARPIIPIQLPMPTGLSATQPDGETKKTVNLFWVDLTAYDDAVRGYRVFRRKVDSKAKPVFKPLFDSLLSSQQNYFTDTTFTEFGIYEYAVQAFGMFGSESAMSASVQVEYKKLPPVPPADVRAIPTEEGVRITWGEVVQERLTGYKLYRYERGKTPTVLATLKPNEQTFLDKSAKKGTLYFYFVTSIAKTDESVPSEEVGLRP